MPGEPTMLSHCGYQNNNSLGQSQNSQPALAIRILAGFRRAVDADFARHVTSRLVTHS